MARRRAAAERPPLIRHCLIQGHLWQTIRSTVDGRVIGSWCPACGASITDSDRKEEISNLRKGKS